MFYAKSTIAVISGREEKRRRGLLLCMHIIAIDVITATVIVTTSTKLCAVFVEGRLSSWINSSCLSKHMHAYIIDNKRPDNHFYSSISLTASTKLRYNYLRGWKRVPSWMGRGLTCVPVRGQPCGRTGRPPCPLSPTRCALRPDTVCPPSPCL